MALYDTNKNLIAGSRKTNIYRCNSFAEYEALPAAEKAKYDYVATPEDINTYSYLTSSQSWISEWTEFNDTENYLSFYSFTVPYSGKYRLHSSLIYNIDNTDSATVSLRYLNYTTSQQIHRSQIAAYGNSRQSINMDCIVELNAGDVIYLQFLTESAQTIRWIQRDANHGDYWQYLG